MKVKSMALKVVSLVATVLTFVGLALKFAYKKIAISGLPDGLPDAVKNNLPSSGAQTRKDWVDSFSTLKGYKIGSVAWWQVARVFMIISLVIIAIVAVVSIVQLFYNHKILSVAKLVLSCLGIASIVVFAVTLITGSVLVADKLGTIMSTTVGLSLSQLGITSAKVGVTFLPNVGAYFIMIFGLIAMVAALLDKKVKD